MTNGEKIRNMTNDQLAVYLTDMFMDQDWLDKLYRTVCKDRCPISGNKCLIHEHDDACKYMPEDIFLEWLNEQSVK